MSLLRIFVEQFEAERREEMHCTSSAIHSAALRAHMIDTGAGIDQLQRTRSLIAIVINIILFIFQLESRDIMMKVFPAAGQRQPFMSASDVDAGGGG